MLYLKCLPYETIEEPIRKWTPWLQEWGARTGVRIRVPVLRVINEKREETVYTESNTINLMLDKNFGEVKFTPDENSLGYQEMLRWFSWCDEILKPHIDLFKYGANLQFNKIAHIEHTKKLREILVSLEHALEDKKYLLNDVLSLADIAIIPFIRQIMRTRDGEFDFSNFPNIQNWALLLIESDWFSERIMRK